MKKRLFVLATIVLVSCICAFLLIPRLARGRRESSSVPGLVFTSRSDYSPIAPLIHEQAMALENHTTICVQKAAVEVVIGYSDEYRSSNFRPPQYPDGKDRVLLPVECGGSYA